MRPLLLILVLVSLAGGEILHVPGEYSSIQEALDSSAPLDTVLVAQGTYLELLTTPEWSVTLASHYILSGDTTDIQQTILDGNHQGTVLTVHTNWPWVFSLCGFTIQHGMGEYESMHDFSCGALELENDVALNFKDLVFRNNTGVGTGAIYADHIGEVQTGDFTFSNIHLIDNDLVDPVVGAKVLYFFTEGTVTLSGLRISDTHYLAGPTIFTGGRLIASDIARVEPEGSEWRGLVLSGENYLNVRDVTVAHCFKNSDSNFLTLTADTVICRNVSIYDTHKAGGNTNSIMADEYCDIDSVFVHHNTAQSFEGCIDIKGPGLIRNVEVTDNVLGDSLSYTGEIRRMMFLEGRHIENLKFNRNRIYAAAPDTGQTAPNFIIGQTADYFSQWVNCEFLDNYMYDGDDHSSFTPPWPSNGRVLYLKLKRHADLELHHCRFENNRLDGHVAEVPGMGFLHRAVGSTLFIDPTGGYHDGDILLDDVQVIDNDDGGVLIDALDTNKIEINQLIVRNTPRLGLDVRLPDTLIIRNSHFENIDEQDMYLGYPYDTSFQDVLRMGGEYKEVSNITVMNCDQTVLLRSSATFHNSIFHGNQFDFLQVPDWTDPTFSYSITEPGMSGSNNLQLDPLFDSELGPPYLSPASPAIDAGNPDPIYNDIEDPEAPGFALWPSQGDLRNDMGYTGGPGARELDPQVSVIPKEPPALPASIALYPAWPNPFNPATTVAFDLPNSAPVTLTVYNLRGQKVRTLLHDLLTAGRHEVVFRAEGLASGVYFLRLAALGEVRTGKVLLLK